MAESKLSLKLLINTQTNRVLFAEAGKDCVAFWFHILSLPVATVISLLKEQGMVGCLGNLYESVEGLDEMYILSDQKKDVLLMPVGSPAASSVSSFLLESSSPPAAKVGYTCSVHLTTNRFRKSGQFNNNWMYSPAMGAMRCNGQLHFSDDQNAICPTCKQQMTSLMTYVAPPDMDGKSSNEGGFVKGVVTYMVMDDLVVKPMSIISSLTLINKFKVNDVAALQEKEAYMGMTEAVKLLKASLHSKNVLTEVFLTNK